jgi:hypothetical protein
VEKSKFVPQLSTWKNRDLVPKNFLQTMGSIIVWAIIICSAQATAQQVEIKDIPPLPQPPKLSSFAPAKDLADQAPKYIRELEAALESEQEFKDSAEKIGRLTNTLGVIALCLGLHDENNEFKPRAAALIKATKELAAAVDYQSAKKAFDALKAAAESNGESTANLKWEKVASLPELMKQVPNINTKLKLNITGTKFKTKAKDTAGYTAVIGAIAQGSMADVSKAKNPQEVKQWYEYMAMMRDAAGEANAAIHAGNQPVATEAVMKKLAKSCDDCHKVFHPEALLLEEKAAE